MLTILLLLGVKKKGGGGGGEERNKIPLVTGYPECKILGGHTAEVS